ERRLTIEQPVPLKPRGGYPGPFSCQAGDLIAVAESKALHVLGNRLIGGRCCVKIERRRAVGRNKSASVRRRIQRLFLRIWWDHAARVLSRLDAGAGVTSLRDPSERYGSGRPIVSLCRKPYEWGTKP